MDSAGTEGLGFVWVVVEWGGWKEPDLVSVQTEIGGKNARTTQIGGFYSKPAGLALSHAGHLF